MDSLKVARTGNEAMAEAMRQINPDVVAAYPITPSTEVVQIFSQFVADGLVDTEFVAVESEHSAMSATLAASAAGARAMTVTASQGLALMYEMLYIAAGLRLPIVLPEVNRSLSSPINIHADHSDTMGARDTGWIQIFSENAQEAYDSILQAVKITENANVLLPAMVTDDGFIISHCTEIVELIPDDVVKEYLGIYEPKRYLLDFKNPYTLGAIDLQDYYFEHRRQLAEAMRKAKQVVVDVGKDFGKRFGREYGLFHKYQMDDADACIVVMGSAAGTAREVVDIMRKDGKKVGMLKLRVFRPFPVEELAQALAPLPAVGIMDRSDSCDAFGGQLYDEVRSAMYDLDKRPKMLNYIYGLGGRDVMTEDIAGVFEQLLDTAGGKAPAELVNYVGVRA
jgi:pyruvate ferredoxin oxidoreductase alpha subunit